MGIRRFDRKFGVDRLRELPEAPGVYLFRDASGGVLYVGKAKNLRRRLAQYRNASRRKAHRKMRELVRVAHSLDVRIETSETDALLLENVLIREHRPEYNVEGAFEFLYPAIGTGMGRAARSAMDPVRGVDAGAAPLWLCIVSNPEPYSALDLRWHGCFRPRWRAREAFDALVSLCGRVGHLEPKSRLPALPAVKGTRFVAVRRMGDGWLDPIRDFFDGESDALLGRLFEALLERQSARLDRAAVQLELDSMAAFYREDVRRLRDARRRVGRAEVFVPQAERDALFIRDRAEANAPPSSTVSTSGSL